ncbi:unnamed protein product [Cylicocyclus nassatus]|uniref:Uncharacterized protein n=1 Tax=Cylicocyclus nassatus TaxID=53992 RepID=A0AA36H2Q7_CYLNA|nr:unnamed protein product [Cylicocyclus nassatus]
MSYYGIGELQYYIKKTDENLRKAIQLLLALEQKLGGSTGELDAYRKTLKDIRCDIVDAQRDMRDRE